MSEGRIVQPPRIAAWFVALFTTQDQKNAQEGILEEFSDRASRRGLGPAERWYWRQSAKTIAGLMVEGFRTAPWLIVGTVLGGFLLLDFSTSHLQRMIVTVILFRNHHITPYYSPEGVAAYFFWLRAAVLVGSLLESLIVGCLVAAVAKRREMVTTIILSIVSLVLTATEFWMSVLVHDPVDPALFPAIMVRQLGAAFMLVIGGIVVREVRSAEIHDLSRA